MCGSETPGSRRDEPVWYDLIDPATEAIVGQVTRGGEVRSDDPEVVARVRRVFDRELLTRDSELAEELGVCFADIETVSPDDAGHHDLVFRSLGVLTGLIPALPEDADSTG